MILGAQFLVPLLAMPWLARELGPEAFSLLLYMSVLVAIWEKVMEWGLAAGAPRRVAEHRENPEVLAQILADVMIAKLLLLLICCIASLVLFPFLTHAVPHPEAYGAALAAGVVRGLNPTWFFQGMGHSMRRMSLYEVGSGTLILALTIILVDEPQDWPLYMVFTAVCKGLPYGWLTLKLWRRYPCKLGLAQGCRMLVSTSVLFVGGLAGLVYYRGGLLLIGHFVPPMQMGMLLVADKIVRAAVCFARAITETIYPEVSALRTTQPDAAMALLRFGLRLILGLMLLGAVCIWFGAPWLVQLALGPGYEQASDILRILACLIPVIGCSYALGSDILVPLGEEKHLTMAQCVSALVCVPLAVALCFGGDVVMGAFYGIIVESIAMLWQLWHAHRVCPAAFSASKRVER